MSACDIQSQSETKYFASHSHLLEIASIFLLFSMALILISILSPRAFPRSSFLYPLSGFAVWSDGLPGSKGFVFRFKEKAC
jgi:hypothetical protein